MALMIVAAFTFQSCHTKKLLTKPAPPALQPAPAPAPAPKPAPAPVKPVQEAPQKPDLNFTNIQFDFNSVFLVGAKDDVGLGEGFESGSSDGGLVSAGLEVGEFEISLLIGGDGLGRDAGVHVCDFDFGSGYGGSGGAGYSA